MHEEQQGSDGVSRARLVISRRHLYQQLARRPRDQINREIATRDYQTACIETLSGS